MLKCKEFRLRIDLASTCAKQPLSDLFSQHPSNILEIHFPCIQLMGGDGSWLYKREKAISQSRKKQLYSVVDK